MLRAFVVQLQPGAEFERGKFAGLVEHVDSGRSKRFHSIEELASFMEQTLAEIKRQIIVELTAGEQDRELHRGQGSETEE